MLEAKKLEITETHKLERSNTFTISVNPHPKSHNHTAKSITNPKPETHHNRAQFKVPSAVSRPRVRLQENRPMMLNSGVASTTTNHKNASADSDGKISIFLLKATIQKLRIQEDQSNVIGKAQVNFI